MKVSFDIKAIDEAIKSCQHDIPLKYDGGTTRNNEAFGRIRTVELVLFNLGLRPMTSGEHTPLGDTLQTWMVLEDYFGDFPANFRSAEEEKLNLLLLKGVFNLSEKDVNMPAWKRDKIDNASLQLWKPVKSVAKDDPHVAKKEKVRRERLQDGIEDWTSTLFHECVADSLAYSEENTGAFLNKKLEISSGDIGQWLFRTKSFTEIVASLRTIFHLKSHVQFKHTNVWVQDTFTSFVWQMTNAKPFWNLFGKRIVNLEDSLTQAIKLVINARPLELRTYRLTKVTYDGVDQQLGIIDSLLIDGKTMNWQVAEKTEDGSVERDTELLDLYFARNKHMRYTPNGVLTVTMEKEDTTSQIEKEIVIEFHLHFVHGPQDFCSLIQARGAVLTAVKQSAPKQSVNMSSEEAAGANRLFNSTSRIRSTALPAAAGKAKTSSVKQKAKDVIADLALSTLQETQHQRCDGRIGDSSTERPKNYRLPLDRTLASDKKSSRPIADVDVNPKKKEVIATTITATATGNAPTRSGRACPTLANALVIDEEERKSARIGTSKTSREVSMSLTPLPSEDYDVAMENAYDETADTTLEAEEVQAETPGLNNSATRKSARTYSKANRRTQMRDDMQEKTISNNDAEKERISLVQHHGGREFSTKKAVTEGSASLAKITRSAVTVRSTRKVGHQSPPDTVDIASKAVEIEGSKVTTHQERPDHLLESTKDSHQSGGSSEGQRELRRSARVRGTVVSTQGRKPKVQADLFYDQPQAAPAPEKQRQAPKTTTSVTTPRDVRFSSPLENIPSNGTASKDYRSRPSLKTRLHEDSSHARPMVQVAMQTANVVNALEIIVQPPSTVSSTVPDISNNHSIQNASESHTPFDDPESDISERSSEAENRKEALEVNRKEAGAPSTSRFSTLQYAEGTTSLKLGLAVEAVQKASPIASVATYVKTIRGSRATIDEQLEADLRDSANGNQVSTNARTAAKDKHTSSRVAIAEVDTTVKGGSVLRGSRQALDKQQERLELDRALGIFDENDMDEVEPISFPDLTKTRKKKRSAIEAPNIEKCPPEKKTKRKHNQISAQHPLGQERLGLERSLERTDFMEVDSEPDLTHEELSMREVTWETTRQTMQAPERASSAAQERLQALVLEVLQEIFADK
ncbi:hypothetical protein QFC21_004245 [Naganishia friedmannii]|uniref:Uncharacterized protein n=1 Tax=Naganishia friedmannii TaxID=89922 RepID=A0ACC2VHF9_9TREE|nr:hypothetical protein QFC21_004245 [Naganishia friedmannii]